MRLVYAVDSIVGDGIAEAVLSADGFWDWMRDDYYYSAQNLLRYILDRSVCPRCPDTSGRHNFEQRHTEVDGVVGDYDICEYCGKSSGEVLSAAYDSMVSAMPATEITSDNKLIWHTTVYDLDPTASNSLTIGNQSFGLSPSSEFPIVEAGATIELTHGGGFGRVGTSYPGAYLRFYVPWARYFSVGFEYARFLAPVEGYYRLQSTNLSAGTLVRDASGTSEPYSFDYEFPGNSGASGVRSIGDSLVVVQRESVDFSPLDPYDSASDGFHCPVFEIVPDSIPAEYEDDYSAMTRPASIVGDYSFVGDGNEVTVDNRTIVDEGETMIYNPVTGDTTSYDSWAYDYSARTYAMMDNTNNSTSTVTYGDEHITIIEGGNTYNVYYGTANQGSGDSANNSGETSDSGIFGKIGDLIGSLFSGVLDIVGRILGKILDALTSLVELITGKLAFFPKTG